MSLLINIMMFYLFLMTVSARIDCHRYLSFSLFTGSQLSFQLPRLPDIDIMGVFTRSRIRLPTGYTLNYNVGIAIWLVPSPSTSYKLQQIMDFRPSQSKSNCRTSYPHFAPHVTLASGLPPSISMASVLACIRDQASLPVMFKSIHVGDTYFSSVSISIHHSPKLSALRQHIDNELQKLGVEPCGGRFHMSLYYIDDSEADERYLVADELLNSRRVVQDGRDRIALNCFADDRYHLVGHSGFDGEHIWVVKCIGPVEKWEVLEKVTLFQP
jgi:2',3'-cyclic-nucleotide 3'-phosphodiesterase